MIYIPILELARSGMDRRVELIGERGGERWCGLELQRNELIGRIVTIGDFIFFSFLITGKA